MAKKSKADDELEAGWNEILEASGELAGSVTIWRKEGGKRPYVDNVPLDRFRDDPNRTLKELYGGGEYVTQLVGSDGKYIAGSRAHFDISGPRKSDEELARSAELAEVNERLEKLAGGGSSSSSDGMSMVLVEMIRQNGQIMRDLRNPPAQAEGVNPAETTVNIITSVAGILGPIVTELLKNREKPSSPLEQMELMVSMMELAKGMGGPTDGVGALAKTLGEPISKLVDAHLQAQGGGAAALPPGAARPNPPAGAQPAQANGAQAPAWYPLLARYMPTLLTWANKGIDPETRGEFVLEELDDSQLEPVYITLTHPTFPQEFYQAFPAAAPHREWFDAFFRYLVEGIMSPDEVEAAEQIQAQRDAARAAEEQLAAGDREEAESAPELGRVAPGDDGGDR